MRLLPPAQFLATDTPGHETANNASGTPQPSTSPDLETETDAEVDQLDSDSDMDEMESASSNGQEGATRPPGSSLLPTTRLENILQADGVTGNLALSKEALFVLSIATEEFIKRMARTGHIHASAQRRNAVSYTDMAAATQQYQEFMFLKDTIPSPISLAEAMQLRQAKEKEMLEDDPALAINPTISTVFPLQNGVSSSKSKGKGRNSVNGHEKANGKSNPNSRQHYNIVNAFPPNPPWNNAPNGSNAPMSSGNVPPFVNGDIGLPPNIPHTVFVSPDTYDGRSGHIPSHVFYPPNSLPDRQDEAWLRGPGLVDPSDNLGRTIYTKDRHGA